jgi:hypothetical protein
MGTIAIKCGLAKLEGNACWGMLPTLSIKKWRDYMKSFDMTNQRFGRLTVVSRASDYVSPKGQHQHRWNCLCDCGNMTIATIGKLRSGHSKSCGCLIKDATRKRSYKHGKIDTRIYGIWTGMKTRCDNPKRSKYARYGARGVTVCKEWREDFKAFYDWAMQNGYSENLSIDRINVDGDYEPSNCKWSTDIEQMNNMSTNVKVTYNGKTQTIAEWSRETGIPYGTLHQRIYRYNFSPERALNEFVYVGGRYKCEA